MTLRTIALIAFFVLLFGSLLLWVFGGSKDNIKQDTKPLNKWDGRQLYINAVDSTKMAEQLKYRARLDSISQRYDSAQARIDTVYKRVAVLDRQVEIRYRDNPSSPLADEVIKSKNNRIDTLEKMNQMGMAQIALEKRRTAAADSMNAISRQTIVELNTAFSELNESYKKVKGKKWAVGVGVNHGYTPKLKRETVVGISLTRTIFRL